MHSYVQNNAKIIGFEKERISLVDLFQLAELA